MSLKGRSTGQNLGSSSLIEGARALAHHAAVEAIDPATQHAAEDIASVASTAESLESLEVDKVQDQGEGVLLLNVGETSEALDFTIIQRTSSFIHPL